MLDAYHPPLDLATIRMLPLLLQQISEYGLEAYLEGSPYPQDTREILARVLTGEGAPAAGEEELEVNVDEAMRLLEGENLERELAILYSRLRAFGTSLERPEEGAPKAKASDKSSYFRTTVSLMTKIVELREKASNISQWMAFKNRVMGLLSNVMTPDQRNAFLDNLKADFEVKGDETPADFDKNPLNTPENPQD